MQGLSAVYYKVDFKQGFQNLYSWSTRPAGPGTLFAFSNVYFSEQTVSL